MPCLQLDSLHALPGVLFFLRAVRLVAAVPDLSFRGAPSPRRWNLGSNGLHWVPQCLSAAALWAAVASYKHVVDSGQSNCMGIAACLSAQNGYLLGLNTIVTVSKAVQTLALASTGGKVQAHVQANAAGHALATGGQERLAHLKKLW